MPTQSDDGALSKIQALEAELQLQEEKIARDREEFMQRERELQNKISQMDMRGKSLEDQIFSLMKFIQGLKNEKKISESEANKFIEKMKEDVSFKRGTVEEIYREFEQFKEYHRKEISAIKDENKRLKVSN